MHSRKRMIAQLVAVVLLAAAATWITHPAAPAGADRASTFQRPRARERTSRPVTPETASRAVEPVPESQAAVAAFEAVGGTVMLTDDGQVRAVDLTGTSITDDDLRHLSATPRLTLLNLDGTAVTDEAIPHLCRLPELSILRLCRTQITDVGLERLDGVPKLTDLILDDTAVTDAGVGQLGRLSSLKKVYVMGCPVTERAREMVHEQLPKCRVKL